MKLLSGWKTYLAAAGLAGLALYQLTQGDLPAAWTSLMAALAAAGLRHAVAKHGARPQDPDHYPPGIGGW